MSGGIKGVKRGEGGWKKRRGAAYQPSVQRASPHQSALGLRSVGQALHK